MYETGENAIVPGDYESVKINLDETADITAAGEKIESYLLSFGIVVGEFLIRLRRKSPYDSVDMLFQVLEE